MSARIRIPGVSAHLQLAMEADGFTFKNGPSGAPNQGGQWWLVGFESDGRMYDAWVHQGIDGVWTTQLEVRVYHLVKTKESRLSKNPGARAKLCALCARLSNAEVAA